jgi:hypothetical protein
MYSLNEAIKFNSTLNYDHQLPLTTIGIISDNTKTFCPLFDQYGYWYH